MAGPRVGIVIPALNEAASIARVVGAARRWGDCIVVDDGSSDATAALAADAGAVVVRHAQNRGYDGALNSGFARAVEERCDVIVTLDADGQHDPQLVARLLAAVAAGADVVVGERSRRARLGEHAFAWYTTLRWGIRDPLCGLKAYRTSVYRSLGHFDSYGSVGTELMLFALRSRLRVEQLPFQVHDREGQPRFGRRLAANYKIFRALFLSPRARPPRVAPC
jgi:glycosyltransferase involved in cell wall biosynthesis